MIDRTLEGAMYLVQKKQTPFLRKWLAGPDLNLWNMSSEKTFSSQHGNITSVLRDEPNLSGLLDLSLLTSFLLFRENAPDWAENWLENNIDPEFLPAGRSLKDAVPGKWAAAPVFLLDRDRARIMYFIAGVVENHEDERPIAQWASRVMSEKSLAQVRLAAHCCLRRFTPPENAGLFCYPLTVPNHALQVTGRSLGLPVALGFMRAVNGCPMPRGVASAGALDDSGKILPVGGLEQKAETAASENFEAFIVPARNDPPARKKKPAFAKVKDLDRAWVLLNLYSRENAGLLNLFSTMLDDPRRFVSNIRAVPRSWLDWADEDGSIRPVVEKIVDSPELFASLTERFAEMVRSGRTRRADSISKLISMEKDLARAREKAPLTAFTWASLNLCMSNHHGRIFRARKWARHADSLLDEALKADIHRAADYFNYLFVSRHNQYRFSRQVPTGLQRILDLLENQYRLQCDFGCPVHRPLGALYGSLAQNSAFRGPEFLEKTEDFSARARQALGENAAPEFREEWMRQYNYLVYAYLDAGPPHAEKASQTLETYLGFDLSRAGPERFEPLDRWRHALVARFLADTGTGGKRTYLEACEKMSNPANKTQHPWQLCFFNLGRIALSLGENNRAAEWFERSLRLCESEHFGPTVRMMAMLPLAWLARIGAIDTDSIRARQANIRKDAETLNPEHFRIVLDRPLEKVLESIRNDPSTLFPFSYR